MNIPVLPKKPVEKDAERVNNIMLGPLERPALAWMAKKMPAWITPDTLTVIGFLATVLIFVSYILTNWNPGFLWLASFGFLLNWFGDSLDGTLARHRHIERPRYGFFIDHTVDALSEVLVFLGIGLSPYVKFDIACLALIGYLLFSILVYIMTYVKGVFRISYLKLGPTEMRVLAIIANAVVFFSGNFQINLPFGTFTLYDLIAIFVAVLLSCGFIIVMLWQANELSKEDVANREKKAMKAKEKKLKKTSSQITDNL
jgi:phosphatidylglycerophosphate synthase